MNIDLDALQQEYDEAMSAYQSFVSACQSNVLLSRSIQLYRAADANAIGRHAAESLIDTYAKLNGTATLSAEVRHHPPAVFNANKLWAELCRLYPSSQLKAATHQMLLDNVWRGLRLGWGKPPRQTASGWAFESYGAQEKSCSVANNKPRATFETAESLRNILPNLAEVLTPDGEDPVMRIAEVRQSIVDWERERNRSAAAQDMPAPLGWRLRLFKEKLEIHLPQVDAERLQVAMAERYNQAA